VNPAGWPGGLAYLTVYVAAVLEGEVVFAGAAVMVSQGHLSGPWVFLAAALGGSTGDQFFYYLVRGVLHGHLRRFLDRFPALARRHQAIVERVHRHRAKMILACRFLPGLRVAIPAACAYARVPGWLFSLLNLISAFAWAGTVMLIVAWGGPNALERIGLRGWWAAVVPAVILLLFFSWLGRATRKLEDDEEGGAA
jgi:membrane protein DedA with SNARE-associated domain